MANNKFIDFVKNNDIKSNNQAYVCTKVLCNKNGKNDKPPYYWIRLLHIRNIANDDGVISHQIYLYDYFSKDTESVKDINTGDLVSFKLSDFIGKQCKIIEIKKI